MEEEIAEAVPVTEPEGLDEFLDAYVTAALWSTNDNADDSGGEPLDLNYDASDIAPEGYGQELCSGIFQAAGFSLMPSLKTVPLTTSTRSGDPFNDRQPFDALSISLNTIVRHATRLPLPLVLSCRSRTVENTDSIGLVVRMWTQCSAGKS